MTNMTQVISFATEKFMCFKLFSIQTTTKFNYQTINIRWDEIPFIFIVQRDLLSFFSLVRNHALGLFHKTIPSPIFVRLQTFLDSFPLLYRFLLPAHQIHVRCEILERCSGRPTKWKQQIWDKMCKWFFIAALKTCSIKIHTLWNLLLLRSCAFS